MKHLLDTNVVSDLLRLRVDPMVAEWSERQSFGDQAVSVVTLAELRFGIELMPAGQRRQSLERAIQLTLPARFGDRVLPIGPEIADVYGQLLARGRLTGFDVGDRDLLIAATALVHGLVLVTRNETHFMPLGVPVLNPWDASIG